MPTKALTELMNSQKSEIDALKFNQEKILEYITGFG